VTPLLRLIAGQNTKIRTFMHQDVMPANAVGAGELSSPARRLRAARALFAILLATMLGAGLIGVVFYAGMKALAR
jgi:hypothetical protein